MNKFRIEFETENQVGSELIFADKKVDAIKAFLKGHKTKQVIIKKINYDGYLRTYPGASSIIN